MTSATSRSESANLLIRISNSKSSLRANGSRECAPDDRLREAIQNSSAAIGLDRPSWRDGIRGMLQVIWG